MLYRYTHCDLSVAVKNLEGMTRKKSEILTSRINKYREVREDG